MSEDIHIDGMTLSPGVLEKIVSVATGKVEGVAGLGASGFAGLVQKAGKRDVDVCVDEDGIIVVSVHIHVRNGRPIREVAAEVQAAVAGAVSGQIGRDVGRVDVYVDSIEFGD